MITKIENRSDLMRDENTGAILYTESSEIKTRRKLKRIENELNSMRDEMAQVKLLLERLIENGR
ncbi:MAG TPA: hypothetical protein DCX27_22205 [Balneola sp.]|nr:hypothetical protein [Balneola sp.]|tara:strand:+ start:349 stop:540 length:192 start_codon:yes stop_codon:yes gene_type:complete